MKKYKIIFVLIFALLFLNIKIVQADELIKCNYININIDGQVGVDYQVNGVCQDYQKENIDISDIVIIVDENNNKRKYENFSEASDINGNKTIVINDIEILSENFEITIIGRIISKELNTNVEFSKKYSNKDFESNICNCLDLKITSEELKRIITYDVIFKSDFGGKFEDNQDYIEHINMINGKDFPIAPEVVPNDKYSFLGWYDESNGEQIKEFPKKVDKDIIVIAKWSLNESTNNNQKVENKKNSDKNIDITEKNDNKNNLSTKAHNVIIFENDKLNFLESDNPPKTIIENSIVVFIVSFIMSLNLNIGI